MRQHNLTPGTSLHSGQGKDTNRLNQFQTLFRFLPGTVAAASNYLSSTAGAAKSIYRYRRDLGKAALLWEPHGAACKETSFMAWCPTIGKAKVPDCSIKLNLK
jgi:hypothetical protein